MQGVVLKPFPFAFDGNTFTHLKADDDFPPFGYAVNDRTFNGLADAGYIRAVVSATSDDEIELNRQIIEAIDKRLSGMSDEDLKSLIARRGEPFTGNLIHAVLVSEAKVQLLAEYQGRAPVTAVGPEDDVAEQPRSAADPAGSPPVATVAPVQKATQAGQQQAPTPPTDGDQQGSDDGTGGEATETDQPNEDADASKSDELSEAELNAMNKADLEAYAAKKGVDISQAKTKADYVEALKPKAEPAATVA